MLIESCAHLIYGTLQLANNVCNQGSIKNNLFFFTNKGKVAHYLTPRPTWVGAT